MKTTHYIICRLAAAALVCCTGCVVMAQSDFEVPQYPQYVQYPPGPPVAPIEPAAQLALTPAQIDQLLGPIALYPDPLLSLIFPASTYPQDVTAAEAWLTSTPNPTESAIDAQPWDASIKGLVHYPTVLKMMSDQIEWTQALGAAFLGQQKDVMASVQRLRAEAQAAGNLQNTQQNQIVMDNSAIRIEPVDPNTIYVPAYDPDAVYYGASPIVYTVGYPIGLWCDYDFDWGGFGIVVGDGWYNHWHHPAEWDAHPPTWARPGSDHHQAPHTWARDTTRRDPPPRINPTVVQHLNLDRPRGTAAGGPIDRRPGPVPVGHEPPTPESHNAFEPGNRADAQHAVERARPAPAIPAPRPEPQRAAPVPQRATIPQRPAAPPPRAAPAPPPQRAAPPPPAPRSNAFSGGGGSADRAASQRGNASAHR